ncbi:MAG TPA: ABC transporter ATP-binding protein [Candidatus Sulfotelmatobacter sp.]|nr:ABC transporter ATP-binding protein [Candidatus Sulfotelmatobacter sp.]
MVAGTTPPLLEVRALATHLRTPEGLVRAVDGVSFAVAAGRTLGIVGESGCGKSVTALSILGLVPRPPAERIAGEVWFDGRDLLRLDAAALRDLRGDRIAMVFQEPMTSLNPAYTVGEQIIEVILRHDDVGRAAARARAVELIRRVGIPAPEQRVDDYPHRLSGGMRQRAMIAMALACRPQLLIADEPTTALDVTIQAQILDLLRDLRRDLGMALILITHDLGVVAELCDEVVVMYGGKIVERAPIDALFATPQHPYTIGLLGSLPGVPGSDRGGDAARDGAAPQRLAAIEGAPPNPIALPAGCRFHPRCPFVEPRCRDAEPPLVEVQAGQHAACWRAPLEPSVLTAGMP